MMLRRSAVKSRASRSTASAQDDRPDTRSPRNKRSAAVAALFLEESAVTSDSDSDDETGADERENADLEDDIQPEEVRKPRLTRLRRTLDLSDLEYDDDPVRCSSRGATNHEDGKALTAAITSPARASNATGPASTEQPSVQPPLVPPTGSSATDAIPAADATATPLLTASEEITNASAAAITSASAAAIPSTSSDPATTAQTAGHPLSGLPTRTATTDAQPAAIVAFPTRNVVPMNDAMAPSADGAANEPPAGAAVGVADGAASATTAETAAPTASIVASPTRNVVPMNDAMAASADGAANEPPAGAAVGVADGAASATVASTSTTPATHVAATTATPPALARPPSTPMAGATNAAERSAGNVADPAQMSQTADRSNAGATDGTPTTPGISFTMFVTGTMGPPEGASRLWSAIGAKDGIFVTGTRIPPIAGLASNQIAVVRLTTAARLELTKKAKLVADTATGLGHMVRFNGVRAASAEERPSSLHAFGLLPTSCFVAEKATCIGAIQAATALPTFAVQRAALLRPAVDAKEQIVAPRPSAAIKPTTLVVLPYQHVMASSIDKLVCLLLTHQNKAEQWTTIDVVLSTRASNPPISSSFRDLLVAAQRRRDLVIITGKPATANSRNAAYPGQLYIDGAHVALLDMTTEAASNWLAGARELAETLWPSDNDADAEADDDNLLPARLTDAELARGRAEGIDAWAAAVAADANAAPANAPVPDGWLAGASLLLLAVDAATVAGQRVWPFMLGTSGGNVPAFVADDAVLRYLGLPAEIPKTALTVDTLDYIIAGSARQGAWTDNVSVTNVGAFVRIDAIGTRAPAGVPAR